MATSKLNIFNALPQHASDDEDEGVPRGQFKGAPPSKKNAGKDDKSKGQKTSGQSGAADTQKGKDDHKKNKGTPTPGSHPLERKSGTGYSAFDKKLKKGGAGKGNWGSNKNEKGEEATQDEGNTGEKEETAQEPAGITLEEYYAKHQAKKDEPKLNEAKAKVTSDQLMKELLSNKATVMQTKKAKESDDHKTGKKKTVIDVDHHASVNTEHADLLNFRTGFIEREFRQRSDQSPRREPRKWEEKGEQSKKAEGTTEATGEGEKTETQEEGAKDKEQGERKRGGDRDRERGGYKGGRGGNAGGRGGYKGNYNPQPKVNFEDESSFPKLG